MLDKSLALDIRNISLTFNPDTINERKALQDVTLQLNEGDFVTIIGSNGAGKSTLLNVIAGSYTADHGTISIDGQDVTKMAEHQRAAFIGRLFQDPMKGSAPHMTVEENLGLAFSRGKRKKLFHPAISQKDRAFFKQHLANLELGLEERCEHEVGLLSGGQRQALTLCMATIVPPKLLLLDEHTAALDPLTSEKVMKITQDIVEKHHITTLMITHNLQQALKFGNKTIIMNEGKIIQILEGETRKNMSVDELISMYNKTLDDRALLR